VRLISSRFTALPALGLFAAALFLGNTARAQDSDFNLALHANSHTTAADIGVPAYPGATLYKDKDNDGTVDLGFTFGDTRFRLMVASYKTSDSPAQVFAFYRKPLSRYGEVLECDHGKAVGALTVTRSGLTCSDKTIDHEQTGAHANSNGHELRAGSPRQFRLIGIDEAGDKFTRFGLVYVELPRDTPSGDKPR
jgi:hypothetical protein